MGQEMVGNTSGGESRLGLGGGSDASLPPHGCNRKENLLAGLHVNVVRRGGRVFRAAGNGTHGTGSHGGENGEFDEFHR